MQLLSAQVDQKANLIDMNEQLENKANKQSVSNALHKKANRAEIEVLLTRKIESVNLSFSLFLRLIFRMILKNLLI